MINPLQPTCRLAAVAAICFHLNMNILVTGASGFIGSAFTPRLTNGGHRVVPLRRAPGDSDAGPMWNPDAGQVRLEPAGPLDAVGHLAGENIAQRWTRAAKARIRASRVDATRLLLEMQRHVAAANHDSSDQPTTGHRAETLVIVGPWSRPSGRLEAALHIRQGGLTSLRTSD